MTAKQTKRRAQAIIDSDAYDQETREAISNILKSAPDELAEYVARAEQGETILDLQGEHEKHLKAASQVIRLFNKSSAPDWLTNAMLEAINQAVAVHPVAIWKEAKNGVEDFDVKGLADLFAITQLYDPRNAKPAQSDAQERVTQALHELLNNPQTPAPLYEACADFVADRVRSKTLHTVPFLNGLISSLNDLREQQERAPA